MSKAKEQAQAFLAKAQQHGFTVQCKGQTVVTIHKTFAPGDLHAFAEADMDAYTVLSYAPLKGGSVWGTDGGSVGGSVGLKNGHYTLNKSGDNGVRFTAALRKLLE